MEEKQFCGGSGEAPWLVTALLKKTVIHSVVKPGRINLCVTFSEGLCEGSWVDGFQLLCFCFSFYFLTKGFMQPKLVSAQHIAQTGLEHRILLCPTAKFISVHCHAWLSSALFRQMKIRKLCLCPCLGIDSRPAESLPVSKGMNWSEWWLAAQGDLIRENEDIRVESYRVIGGQPARTVEGQTGNGWKLHLEMK